MKHRCPCSHLSQRLHPAAIGRTKLRKDASHLRATATLRPNCWEHCRSRKRVEPSGRCAAGPSWLHRVPHISYRRCNLETQHCRLGSAARWWSSTAADQAYESAQHQSKSNDSSSREALVYGLLQDRDYVKAGLEFQQLLDDAVQPSIELCSATVKGLCSAALFNHAWSCYQRVQRAGLELRYSAFHHLIETAVRAGRLPEALSAFQALKRQGLRPNNVTYTLLISGLLRSKYRTQGLCDRAYELWQERYASSEPLSLATYTTGMNACVSMGRLDEAQQLLEQLRKSGLPISNVPYNILLKAHAQRGDAVAARRLFKLMRSLGRQPDTYTFNCLMYCFVVRKELLHARAVLDKAQREGVRLDVATWTIYVRGLCGAGLLEEGRQVLEDMQGQGLQPNMFTYATLAAGFVRARRMPDAEAVLALALSHPHLPPNRVLYNTLIKGYSRMDDRGGWARATQLLHDMAAKGLSPGMDTFNILLDTLVRVPDHEGALKLVRQLLGLGLVPDAAVYTTLMKMFRQTGQVDAALKVFGELSRCRGACLDEAAWGTLVSMLAFKGRMAEAEEALWRAVQYTQGRSRPPPIKAFGALIVGYRMLNQTDACVGALRRFIRLGGQPDSRMFDAAIDCCLRNGEHKRGLQVLRAMELANLKVDKPRYKAWFEAFEAQRRQSGSGAAGGSQDANVYLERMKFWLGLPNKYYSGGWP